MRMLLTADIPHEPFNSLVRAGTAGQILTQILDTLKPEAVYFTEQDGHRCAVLVIEMKNASEVPRFAEPFFLKFNADCRFRIVMSADDLARASLDALGKQWA
jgi:hypothetical protein